MEEKKNDFSELPVRVAAAMNPFSAGRVTREFRAGLSLAEIVAQMQPDEALRGYIHVSLSGDSVPQENWARVYPKPGTSLVIRMVPKGGGGRKNPLRTVLSLAVLAASPMLAGSLTGMLGSAAQASFGGFSLGRIVTSGARLLGRLALNALAPPARSRFASPVKESPTLFIQAARNQAAPFARVPRVLGKHRMVPPLGALPYTETVGNDQYLRMLFVWGYGPLRISDLKIGETPLSEFEGIETETREGLADDAPLTLYSNSVIQNDLQAALTVAGGAVTRTTEENADEISVDITLPRGLFKLDSKGRRISSAVQLDVQYSPAGLNQWSAGATSYKPVSSATAALAAKPDPYLPYNGSFPVTRIDRAVLDPASGAVSVIKGSPFRIGYDSGAAQPPAIPPGKLALARIERRSDDAAVVPSGRITDERDGAQVGALYQASGDFLVSASGSADTVSIAAGGLKFPGLLVTASQSAALRKSVSFKVPRGKYDVRVTRVTADAGDDNTFDETVWTALRTVRCVYPVAMTGLAMTALRIKATDQLNGVIDRLNGVVSAALPDWNGSAWVEQETSNPAAIYRHILQGAPNARPLDDDRLDLDGIEAWHANCDAAGRAFNAVIDYDISVRDLLQAVAASGRASPALIDGKWSVVEDKERTVPVQHFTPRNTWGFRGEKAFDDLPHALRVRFINAEKGWTQDERLVFDDGYDESTATVYEMLELTGVTSPAEAWKQGRYHIATARLRPETYTFHADVEHIACTRGDLVRFTHDVPLFGLMSARVKALSTSGGNITAITLDAEVTMEAGKSYAARFRKSDGSSVVLTLATVAGSSQAVTLSPACAVSAGPAVGDLALFGESGQESVELIVHSITPQDNLSARISCVDAAPAVHTAESGEIPAFSAQMTLPAELQRPPAPVVAGIRAGADALVMGSEGALTPAIILTLAPAVFAQPLTAEVRIRQTGETDFGAAQFSAGDGQVTILDVMPGAHYDVRLVYRSASGLSSAPAIIPNCHVATAEDGPEDVSGFSLTVSGALAHLNWDAATGAGLSHYRLKFSSAAAGAAWAESFDCVARIAKTATSVTVPAQAGTWLIKAVDEEGRESAAPAAVSTTLDRISGYSEVAVVDETAAIGGPMNPDSENVVYTLDDKVELDAGEVEGAYCFFNRLDLLKVYPCLLSARITVAGVNSDNTVDNWGSADIVDDWDAASDPATWGVRLQVRITNDNPGASPAWSAWQDFVTGEYTARGFEFRLILTSEVAGVTPSVSALEIKVGMAEWTQSVANVTSQSTDNTASAGTRVYFPEEFYDGAAVTVMPQNMATGDYYVVDNKDWTGFSIRFYNSANARISRTFDYIAGGVGRRSGEGALLGESLDVIAAMDIRPAPDRRYLIDQMVSALKTAGVWAKLDLLYVLAAHDAQAGRINWLSPSAHALTAVSAPVFTQGQGYAGNGTSSYLVNDIKFSSLANYARNDAHLGVWVRSGSTNNNALIGAVTAVSAQDVYIVPARASTAVMRARINDLTGVDSTTPVATPAGHSVVSRGLSTGHTMYKNGASVGAPSASSIGVPAGPLNIGRASTNGGAPAYNANQVCAAHAGKALTAAEVSALYGALNTYLTAIGAI